MIEMIIEFWQVAEPVIKYFMFTVAPIIASIVITVAYLPQTIKTQISKDVKGISFWFWVLINIFLFCMWSNSLGSFIYHNNWQYFMTESINWAFAIWALIQKIVFGKKDRRKAKLENKNNKQKGAWLKWQK